MSDASKARTNGAIEVGVRFRHNPKVYSFIAEGMRLSIGDKVLVRSEKGVDMGEVMELRGRIRQERAEELMPVVRKATEDDLQHIEEQERREKQALKICGEKIEEHCLPMKLIDASLSFDNTRLVFYFSADGRVDFRELVRDLAKTFRLRIELRQIGVRDEAKLLGGLGPCGRRLCCKTFMRDFEPVGIRVAKDQGLALNPNKISGLCDRLMCCLLFEHETYCTLREQMPSRGDKVMTEHGPAIVRDVMLLKEQLEVQLEDGTEVTVKASEVRPWDGRKQPEDAEAGDRGESEVSDARAEAASDEDRSRPSGQEQSGEQRSVSGRRPGSHHSSRPRRKPSGASPESQRQDDSRTREKKKPSDGGSGSGGKKSSSRGGGGRKSRGRSDRRSRGRGSRGGGNKDGGKT